MRTELILSPIILLLSEILHGFKNENSNSKWIYYEGLMVATTLNFKCFRVYVHTYVKYEFLRQNHFFLQIKYNYTQVFCRRAQYFTSYNLTETIAMMLCFFDKHVLLYHIKVRSTQTSRCFFW